MERKQESMDLGLEAPFNWDLELLDIFKTINSDSHK